jgi:lipoprotein-anchoring transpeptidase ErfK/SrfK
MYQTTDMKLGLSRNGRRLYFRISRWLIWTLALLLLLAGGAFAVWVLLIGDVSSSSASADYPDQPPEIATANLSQPEMEKLLTRLRQRNKKLRHDLETVYPRDVYIVIDTAQNKLMLKKNDQVLREAVCSTGSGRELADPNKNRKWVFDTPRGEFHVRGKVRNPTWRKPDWAFIEEGLPVPKREEDRYESGVLGDYGLAFGDGFFIHGTLYTRLLGKSVTHGCVRLGDEDLAFVYENAPIGARLFIY